MQVQSLGHVQPSVTPWSIAYQAPLSMGFSRQEYWSGLPFPPPGDLPDPEIEPVSPIMCVLVCACVLVAQSCPTLCNPIDCSL